MFGRFSLVIVLIVGLIGCGQAYHFRFYRPQPVSEKIISADWGLGTVFRIDNACVWLVQGNTVDTRPAATTFMAVIPTIPHIPVGETDIKRTGSMLVDFWITLISDNIHDPYHFNVSSTSLRFGNGESTGPRLIQLSKFSYRGENLDVQHEPVAKVDSSGQVVLDWEVVRLHLLFVKPSETAKPVSITFNGIARRGQPSTAVEFRLREESNSYAPGLFVRDPSGNWPLKQCKELIQPSAKSTSASKEAAH